VEIERERGVGVGKGGERGNGPQLRNYPYRTLPAQRLRPVHWAKQTPLNAECVFGLKPFGLTKGGLFSCIAQNLYTTGAFPED
jgi:hypothetical protein